MLTVDDKDVARHAAAANGPSAPSRLAQTIDHQRADDLVQETWVRAFAEDPGAFERPRLVQILTDLAAGGEYSIEVRPAEAGARAEGFSTPTPIPPSCSIRTSTPKAPMSARGSNPPKWLAWCAPDT